MGEIVTHEGIGPVYDSHSKILILGTIPSPKSREVGFYYGHPQNRFWKILSDLFQEPLPQTNQQRKQFVLEHHIALWDVLASCEIEGANDSSIKNPVANDIGSLIPKTKITAIFTTGKKAYDYYKKYCFPKTSLAAISLPSTSPANCRNYTFESLLEAYQVLCDYV